MSAKGQDVANATDDGEEIFQAVHDQLIADATEQFGIVTAGIVTSAGANLFLTESALGMLASILRDYRESLEIHRVAFEAEGEGDQVNDASLFLRALRIVLLRLQRRAQQTPSDSYALVDVSIWTQASA